MRQEAFLKKLENDLNIDRSWLIAFFRDHDLKYNPDKEADLEGAVRTHLVALATSEERWRIVDAIRKKKERQEERIARIMARVKQRRPKDPCPVPICDGHLVTNGLGQVVCSKGGIFHPATMQIAETKQLCWYRLICDGVAWRKKRDDQEAIFQEGWKRAMREPYDDIEEKSGVGPRAEEIQKT